MKILIITQYFWPENFKINDLAIELVDRGHKVDVLTGIPNYPLGYAYDGYSSFKIKDEEYKGVKIFRTSIITRGKNSRLRLFMNYISFIISGSIKILSLGNKYNSIFIYEPSPLTVALPAILKSKLCKIPSLLWVTDLWPESVTATIKSSKLIKKIIYFVLNPVVGFIYKRVDKILVTSKAFVPYIEMYGIDKNKIDYFPQWAELLFKPIKTKKYLLGKIPRDSFKIMFAGNIGEAQDFPAILETARLLKDHKHIQWIILGDGRKTKWVKRKINEYGLDDSFHMLGSYPIEKMPEFYANADAMLLSLKDEYIFSITIPAKVQSYLACGKPILAMINGEAADVINMDNAGLTCSAGDSVGLSENILKMSKMSSFDLNQIGENSYNCYKKYFDRKMLFEKAENILESLIYSDK